MIFFYILMFTSPFYHHPFFDRGFGSFTIVKGIGAICAIYALFYMITKGKAPNYFGTARARLFLVICFWGLLSYLSTGALRSWAADPAFSYLSFLVLFFVTLTIVDTPTKLFWSLMSALAGIAFGALYMIREFQKYHAMYADLRPGAVIGDPNYYTLAALLILPVAYFWLRSLRQEFYRYSVIGMFILVSAAVALASSRGGFLGLVAGVGYLVWTSRKRARNAAVLFVLLAVPMLIAPRSPLKRLLHPDYADQLGAQTREEAWRAGLKMIRAKPLTGIGLGLYKPLLGQYSGDPNFQQIAHNSYLEYAAELGIPALLLFLWLLWATFRALDRTRKITLYSSDRFLYPMAAGLQCGIVGCAVGDFFLSAEYLKLFWIVVFLSIPLERFARARAMRKEAPVANAA
ncbi:MAG: O-antigen ligase family protein [Candidatus Acidiferrales bacterium]